MPFLVLKPTISTNFITKPILRMFPVSKPIFSVIATTFVFILNTKSQQEKKLVYEMTTKEYLIYEINKKI